MSDLSVIEICNDMNSNKHANHSQMNSIKGQIKEPKLNPFKSR